jgi:hypothetical protein
MTAILAAALACLWLSGCKADAPPKIALCQGDGLGGANCSLPPGTPLREQCIPDTEAGRVDKFYCPPSALENSWITTQDDAARLLSWCYGGSIKKARVAVEQYKLERFSEPSEE